MKRRLTKAYDRMTMPDRCAQSIERKLEEQLTQRKKGNYTRIQSTAPVRHQGWAIGAALVCLMLVLSVSVTMLFLYAPDLRMERPAETEVTAVPEDHYALATSFSAEKVETFAKIVRSNVLQKNWGALESKICFPLTAQDEELPDWQTFLEWMNGFSLYSSRWKQLEEETCQAMFCNWQGICMAEGFLWINEVEGELKITAIDMEIREEQEKEDQRKQVPEAFARVLAGQTVNFYTNQGEITLEEYCAARWGQVTIDKFAVVDMDADGISEVVVSVQTMDAETAAHLVLRQDGDKICGYPFQPGEMLDLKKDGSFFRRDREHRLYFNDRSSWVTVEVQEQTEKPMAQWHTYPCQSPELLLRSYEYVIGTGWSIFPGHPYFLLEGLAMERAGNAVEVLEYWRNSGVWCQEGDMVYIFDPDAPGTAFYGTLTEEQGFAQFSQVGYYISGEDREYQAEIRNLLSADPEYWVDVHLPSFMGTFGQMVSTPEELAGYFGYTPIPDAEVMQQTRELKALVDEIVDAYMTGGSEAMAPYLAETYQNREKKFFPRDAVIKLMTYSAMPGQVMEVGETLHVSAGIRLEGDDRDYSFNLELVKQKDGWKVEGYHLYISEE